MRTFLRRHIIELVLMTLFYLNLVSLETNKQIKIKTTHNIIKKCTNVINTMTYLPWKFLGQDYYVNKYIRTRRKRSRHQFNPRNTSFK